MPLAQPTTLSFADARHEVEHAAANLPLPDSERLDLLLCPGRVLAEAVLADRDFPPFPRATRDGFALRASDLAHSPARLRIVAEIRAGGPEQAIHIAPGEAAEIMTGAPAPPGSDAVVMVEYTTRAGD
ncbi:MAG TPA: molybdopterin molybdenumtransferase MoeA, partial [Terriglobales bacterium]|nr:molybdopterin molybdenumtransferase MoeA [Terriglobales bacterium]